MRIGVATATWLLSRGLLVWLLLGPQGWVRGDVTYFAESLARLPERGLAGTLVEYPLPAVAVVAVPWLVAELLSLEGGYAYLVMVAAGLTDLGFWVLLWRVGRRRAPVVAWLLAVPLVGATSLARFDLLPGVLCGLAVLLLAPRPRVAAACAALGAAVKLWPVLAVPALAVPARSRREVLVVAGATGAGLAAASLLVGGWSRLVSPLTYQADRGLQVESVAATPVVVASWTDPERWPVGYASSKAYEITGPGVDALLALSTLLTVAYVAGLGLAWLRAWRLGDRLSPATTVWLVLAAVSGLLVVGKVLSPQYLLWLLPVGCAGLAVARSGRLTSWVAGLLVAAGLTQVVFPGYYEHLVLAGDRMGVPVLALLLRNVVLVGLVAVAAVEVRRGLAADGQRGIELDRQPPGPARSAGRVSR